MTGERKTELDKDALEKARDAFILAKYGFLDDVLRTRIAAAISAYLTALPQSALSSRLVEAVLIGDHEHALKYAKALHKAAALGGIPEGRVPQGGTSLSDVRKVTLYFVDGAPQSHLILAAEVDRFVTASKRLHWEPGKNPHNNADAAKVWKITVAEMEMRGPYWWTVPDLQNNDDPAGARIIDGGLEQIAFIDEVLTNRWAAEEAEAEARFYRKKAAAAAPPLTPGEQKC